MKIVFKQLTKATAIINRCCCTGESTQQIWEFDPKEEIEVLSVNYGPKEKIKTRPGRPGGRFRHARIYLNNENANSMHPDYLDNVLETDFEVTE